MAEDVDEALQSLPLFPLHAVLFPGGVLALRIFELRYLDMISRAHREGRPFGVVSLTEGAEVQRPGNDAAGGPYASEAFAAVGTLAMVTQLERPLPGLLAIRCEGTTRFRLSSHARRPSGLWVGQASLLPADPPMAVPEDLIGTRDMLEALLQAFATQVPDPSQRPFQAPYQLDDCAWLANTWCALLPVDAQYKQRLLEIDSPLLRLELVADLIDRIRPGRSL